MTPASPVSNGELLTYALPASLAAAVSEARKQWDDAGNTARLWARDASLRNHSGANDWLGFLDIVDAQLADVSKFKALSAEVKEDGFTHVVVLATDGSALAPDAIRKLWRKPGTCLEFITVDSVDPLLVADVRSRIDPARTLFCVLSRSDENREAELLASWFFRETAEVVGDDAFLHFIAVRSSGSAELPQGNTKYRHVYSNEPNLTAPFDTFSDFGLVPLAAAGIDVEKLLKGARRMAVLSRQAKAEDNPGVSLGITLAIAAEGFQHNKLTFICPESIQPLASLVSQFLADGSGLIPVNAEPIVDTDRYGSDRFFLALKDSPEGDRELEETLAALQRAGHPVLRFLFDEMNDLGQAIFAWQIAAAVAAVFRQSHPSRVQPPTRNVPLPATRKLLSHESFNLFADESNAAAVMRPGETVGGVLRRHLDRLGSGDYFGLLAYIPRTTDSEHNLQAMREGVLNAKQTASILGFGPGFLREAGATCLTGPNQGVFLLITAAAGADILIPDESRSFRQLEAERAAADLQLLSQRDRRILHVDLGSDFVKGLNKLQDLVCAAIEH